VKRLVTAIVVALMLTDAGVALADVKVDRSRVKFKMSSETCPSLSAGTTVKGAGRQRSVTTTSTDPNGITTVVNYTRALGKATNLKTGKRYRFDYRNSFAVSNTTANPALYTGTMFDLFSLVRSDRTRLENGFVARFTTDLGPSATFQPLYSFGDPLDFATGSPHCDPL
jgi:hypothetical protein